MTAGEYMERAKKDKLQNSRPFSEEAKKELEELMSGVSVIFVSRKSTKTDRTTGEIKHPDGHEEI